MRTIVINTGTELLLGEVLNTHLAFIAREILPLGLRVDRQLTVPDGAAIRETLTECFSSADIIFVTGGLGPTTDDITRELTAGLLDLELRSDPTVIAAIEERFARRGYKWTSRIKRQANVPIGAEILPNDNGTAPGLYLRANLVRSCLLHTFFPPGPPRELRPMFVDFVLPVLKRFVPPSSAFEFRTYRIAGMGESLVEEAIGGKVLEISGIELGYCSRPGEVDLRLLGPAAEVKRAEAIVTSTLGAAIFSSRGESMEEVLVKRLLERAETLALAESCTGGLLADRITNVPGASGVFLAGYVTYANAAKTDVLGVDEALIEKEGAVSESVARVMAKPREIGRSRRMRWPRRESLVRMAARPRSRLEQYMSPLRRRVSGTLVKRFDFASDRETFKQLTAQAAFNLLRLRLL